MPTQHACDASESKIETSARRLIPKSCANLFQLLVRRTKEAGTPGRKRLEKLAQFQMYLVEIDWSTLESALPSGAGSMKSSTISCGVSPNVEIDSTRPRGIGQGLERIDVRSSLD